MEQQIGVWSGAAGCWERQAWIVRLLAAELGITLDEQEIVLCDVRNLTGLRQTLERQLRTAAGVRTNKGWRWRLGRFGWGS